jgi:hypothetical protein
VARSWRATLSVECHNKKRSDLSERSEAYFRFLPPFFFFGAAFFFFAILFLF